MPYFLHRKGVDLSLLVVAKDDDGEPDRSEYRTSAAARTCCIACCEDYWYRTDRWVAWACDRLYGAQAIDLPYLGVYDTAKDAHMAKGAVHSPDPLVVTFKVSADERDQWRRREERRDSANRVPWWRESWQQRLNESGHYAHLSPLKPGMIVYTPSEEWGVQDRQLRVRPGKYLSEFAPHLSKSQIDTYVAEVKAHDDRNVVKFAITADEIEAVYRNGPDSCMSHELSEYCSETHPVRVYGDSDIAVAYLGDPVAGKVRARSLVWKARKLHSRIYGDETLRVLLQAAGYSCTPGTNYGDFSGAQISAISHDDDADVWVMPYLDMAERVLFVRPARPSVPYFVVMNPFVSDGSNDVNGLYHCRETNGLTDGNYRSDDGSWMCRHCDASVGSNGALCDSCCDAARSCARCEGEYFDWDDAYTVEDEGLCDQCYSRYSRECSECEERFRTDQFSSSTVRRRTDDDLTTVCGDCEQGVLDARAADAAEADNEVETERA